ncbi:MAG: aspartate kinase [Bacteroidales bacterium]|nr:aspartate kinase [Bacteroidales bacterium]
MKVLKFGGSSVANATRMSGVLDIVTETLADDRVVLISSAISGCTDTLIEIGRKAAAGDRICLDMVDELLFRHSRIISRLFTGQELKKIGAELEETALQLRMLVEEILLAETISAAQAEHIQTFGELFSTKILASKLATESFRVKWLDSRLFVVKDDNGQTFSNIRSVVGACPDIDVFVAPGFIARDTDSNICTLGRGGSDFSAALYAAALNAGALQIWTDVPGIMTSNPKVVPAARTIPRMSYESALCMAEHGAKVLYAPTVAPAMQAGIPINIRNTFDPANPGTIIDRLPESKVCEWMGVSNMPCGENEKIVLTAEGPIDEKVSLKRVVASLKDAGIEPLRTGSEPGCIYADVRPAVVREACQAIHKEFFEFAKLSVIDVYVAGHGAVGTAIEKAVASGLAEGNGRQVHLAAISSDHSFADKVLGCAPRHSVFVDCTNDEQIFSKYVPLLEAGINIVSSNRRSLAVPFVEYAAMKRSAMRNGCFFRYSTTVGTALPILESIAGGANMRNGLEYIEAVVSCTLNHIITGHDGSNTESFATLLQKAQKAGLTEQDPRIDLGGRDALRKLLIIAREAGVPLEEEDVEITPMLGKEYFECSLKEFYRQLEEAEPEFIRREAELDALDKRQRFVASIRRDASARTGYKAEIKMQPVSVESPFYWISGTENVTIIKIENSAPLVIRGAGEGAHQAATAIINEILQ